MPFENRTQKVLFSDESGNQVSGFRMPTVTEDLFEALQISKKIVEFKMV